jgi:hypothetical protein
VTDYPSATIRSLVLPLLPLGSNALGSLRQHTLRAVQRLVVLFHTTTSSTVSLVLQSVEFDICLPVQAATTASARSLGTTRLLLRRVLAFMSQLCARLALARVTEAGVHIFGGRSGYGV